MLYVVHGLLHLTGHDDTTAHGAAEMHARARVRHIRQDSLVRDYQAMVRTRLDATAGRGRFARRDEEGESRGT